LMLADTPERLDWLRMAQARGRYLGTRPVAHKTV
jgi:hypothetical protein